MAAKEKKNIEKIIIKLLRKGKNEDIDFSSIFSLHETIVKFGFLRKTYVVKQSEGTHKDCYGGKIAVKFGDDYKGRDTVSLYCQRCGLRAVIYLTLEDKILIIKTAIDGKKREIAHEIYGDIKRGIYVVS